MCFYYTQIIKKVIIKTKMEDPKFRNKHTANTKKKDKGFIYASKRHVRIEVENLMRQENKLNKNLKK